MKKKIGFVLALMGVAGVFYGATAVAATVDMSGYQPGGKVTVASPGNNTLEAIWSAKDGRAYRAQFNLTPGQPLLRAVETASAPDARSDSGLFQTVARDVEVKYRVTVGNRFNKAGWPYIFFDSVDANKPSPVPYLSRLDLKTVRVISESPGRVKLVFSTLEIGPFTGDLVCYIYDQSPFLQFQAGMLVNQPWKAYIYDALFYADFENVAYQDIHGDFQTVPVSALSQTQPGEEAGIAARYRTILGVARGGQGTLAVMGAPHTTCIYPTDFSDNYGYLQAGKNFIGTKMSPHADGRYRPWVDAPNGSTQRMDVFLVISPRPPQDALAKDVLPYTHGDVYKNIPGYYTMAEHFHPEFTDNYRHGWDTITPFKQAMQAMGVQIVQPMEFHGPGHPMNNTDKRLSELHDMFTLLQKHSDDKFVFIPGEEYNNFFGGHWSYMFPHPVYFTGWSGQGDRDYALTNVQSGSLTFPLVYQVGDAEHMARLLGEQGGIAWSSHPRIKASRMTPDSLVNSNFYQQDFYLAGDWKAMPADFSQDRLGFRAFTLMDDTAQWGWRKSTLGEVDTFLLNPTHEIYAHMNINYLRLPALPSATNWSDVVQCIRDGDFFTTTGELLIHSWNADTKGVTAQVEWYFPPAFAEITWGDANGIHQMKKSLVNETQFGTQTLNLPADLSAANWVRFEIWDVARNGAFTQIHWLKPPAQPSVIAGEITSFTLMDADTDSPVPGFDPIADGAVLDRSALPPRLTFRANARPLLVDRVTLQLDGTTVTRDQWPYSIADCKIGSGCGDSPAYDYSATELTPGQHTLTATPQQRNVTGTSRALHFTVR